MMTRKFFRLVAIFPFALALFIGSTALASGESKFTGVVEALPDTPGFVGDWRVAGRTVHVSNRTEIEQEDGRVRLGAKVKVEGFLRSDGSIDATEVEVKDGSGDDDRGGGDDDGDRDDSDLPQFKGTIQSLPGTPGQIGDWRVGGRTIHVFASTKIETEFGPVAVGAFVEIRGVLRADGSMDAVKIEVESGDDDGRDELKGAIESLPASPGFQGDWRVAGRIVHVTATTVLDQEHGTFVVGALVEVHGLMRADGSIDATRIELKTALGGPGEDGQRATVKGAIQSLPGTGSLIGDWTVADRTVHVTSSTRLKAEHGAFAIGTRVKVKGLRLSDGSIVATKIQVMH
jgi:hypothetical protein